ncbi:MAG: HEAT repeat domain-containing protein [Vicinamibacterales bacterium]
MGTTAVLSVLLGSAVKGSALLGLAALAALWLKRGSAASRHLAWQLGLFGLLALPVVTLVQPFQWEVPALPAIAVAPAAQVAALTPIGDSAPAPAPRAARRVDLAPASPDAAREAQGPGVAVAAIPADDAPAISWQSRVPAWLGAMWLLGAAAVLARFGVGLLVARWYARHSTPLDAVEWASLNETMSFAVGLGHPVRLLKSARAATPMTFGILHPVVLLPADADDWPEDRRRIVMLHELAHVHRLDSLTQCLTQLACAVYWFNPLVWMAARRLRAEAERACDDWVLRAGMRASTYAEHLLDMVKTIGRLHTPAAALPMAQRSTFEGRLLAILEPGLDRNGLTRAQAVALTAVIAIVVVPLAAVTPVRTAPRAAEALVGAPSPVDTAAAPLPAAQSATEREAAATAARSNAPADVPAPDQAPEAALELRRAPASFIGRIARTAIDAVSGALSDKAVETTIREAVHHATSDTQRTISPAMLEALIGALGDSEVDVRKNAAQALGNQEDPRAVDALSRTLQQDQDAATRRMAGWALGQIEDSRAVPALSAALAKDADVEVRRTAAWALGQIESATAIDALTTAMKDADQEVRSQSVWALGQIEDARAVPALTTAVGDADARIRKMAVWALGEIEDRAAVPALTAALKDADEAVREQAVWALGQIEVPEAVDPLLTMANDRSDATRKQVAWALGQIESSRAVEPLTRMLQQDASSDVRRQAAWALGQIEDAAAIPALGAALKDASPGVRRQAAWALGQIERRPAPPQLLEALKDDDVEMRRTVVWALGQIEDPNAAAALRGALADADRQVKTGALRALVALGDEAAYDALAEMLKDPDPEMRKMAAQAMGRGGMRWPSPRPQPQPQPRPQPRPRPNGA